MKLIKSQGNFKFFRSYIVPGFTEKKEKREKEKKKGTWDPEKDTFQIYTTKSLRSD